MISESHDAMHRWLSVSILTAGQNKYPFVSVCQGTRCGDTYQGLLPILLFKIVIAEYEQIIRDQ